MSAIRIVDRNFSYRKTKSPLKARKYPTKLIGIKREDYEKWIQKSALPEIIKNAIIETWHGKTTIHKLDPLINAQKKILEHNGVCAKKLHQRLSLMKVHQSIQEELAGDHEVLINWNQYSSL